MDPHRCRLYYDPHFQLPVSGGQDQQGMLESEQSSGLKGLHQKHQAQSWSDWEDAMSQSPPAPHPWPPGG